jgi:hypothetical protein
MRVVFGHEYGENKIVCQDVGGWDPWSKLI